MTASEMLRVLPPFTNNSVLIESAQDVPDIMREVLAAHNYFAADYDYIYNFFDRDSIREICKVLFSFLKQNVRYVIEGEEKQTTASPSAILSLGYGDCKHYAGFIGGVLAAIERNTGNIIDWKYRFASYSLFDKEVGHVFVVVNDNGKEIWIDPVLNRLDERLQPVHIVDKKLNNMPLYRVSGVEDAPEQITDEILPDLDYNNFDSQDKNLSPDLLRAIHLLLYYDVLSVDGEINDSQIETLAYGLPQDDYKAIIEARQLLSSETVAGLFSDILRGAKKVTLAIPRGAYLSIVALNVFGTATKLKQATTTQDGINKIRDKWYDLGGDWKNLESAINNGSQRARILGIGAAPAAAAWAVTAAVIIAAMTPIINSVLKTQQQAGQLPAGFDAALLNNPPLAQPSFIDFIKENMLWLLAIGAGAFYYFSRKSKRA